MISLAIPLGPACAALLVAALSVPTLAQSPAPSPSTDPGPLRMHDARVSHTATPLLDGSVLVVGGSDGLSAVHASAESFDPATRRFRVVGALAEPRAWHTATALPDGRVLVVGGGSFPGGLATVEAYDPGSETFSRIGRLKKPRMVHAATLLDDGRVLVSGGFSGKKELRPSASAELFDPATGKSESVGKMRHARYGHTATLLDDGRVAVIGGFGKSGKVRAVEIYDPRTRRFKPAVELAAPAPGHSTTKLMDGRLITVAPSATILFAPDASSNELAPGGPRTEGQASTTLLDDGRVVVVGSAGGKPLVDVFDPATNVFEPAGSLTLTRTGPAVTRLSDGTILVVGGLGCQQALDTAEIWDPETLTVVAAGSTVDCETQPMPTPKPLPPLGATRSGGRIEMPGSAFAITVPEDWVVELADPDTDLFTAEPGSAWEALRATDPEGSSACSVAVGVAAVSLREASGAGSGEFTTPLWDPNEPGILWVPMPQVEPSRTEISSMAPRVRMHRHHEGLKHDVLYSVHCVGNSERESGKISDSLEFLPR